MPKAPAQLPHPSIIMAPQKSAAQTFLEKADKKATSSGGWFSSNNSKWEEAGDFYQQAANAFKIDKLFKEAGDAHAREAECRENCKEINEAASAWWNAAKAYKRGYPDCKSSSGLVALASAELVYSGYCCALPDRHFPHSIWSIQAGCRPRERNRSNLHPGEAGPPQGMR